MLVKWVIVTLVANALVDSYDYNNKTHLEGKIVGGELANNVNFPHAVFIHICILPKKEICGYCGSSVLSQRLLITAAHCVENAKSIVVDARAGATDILKATILIDIIYFIYHEKYNTESIFGDIALLMLIDDLPLGKNVKRVVLAPNFSAGVEGRVAGWGSINEDNEKLTVLKSVKQKVWDNRECNKYEELHQGMMCANTGSSSMNYPFHGDSGSGFIIKGYKLIGLVSFRADDTVPDLITYTNVSYYSRWVERAAAKLTYKCCKSFKTRKGVSTRIKLL